MPDGRGSESVSVRLQFCTDHSVLFYLFVCESDEQLQTNNPAPFQWLKLDNKPAKPESPAGASEG